MRDEKGRFIKGNHVKTEFKKGSVPFNKGKKGIQTHSVKERLIRKMRWIGEKNPRWRGGITALNQQIRDSFKNRQWISDIFTRDNFTCQYCFKRGGDLEAHHIKEFWRIISENKIEKVEQALQCAELWNINNGLTLCKNCHNKTKNGRKRKNNS